MSNYDGSIILHTKVDTKGIEIDAKKLANKYKAATVAVEKQVEKVEALKKKLASLESGETTVSDKGVKSLQTDFDKTTASVEKTKAKIEELYMQLDSLQMNAFKAPDTGEISFTGSEQAEFDKITAQLDQLELKLESDKQKAEELGKALKEATGAGTQTEIEKTKTKLADAELKLEGMKIKADEAGQKLNDSMKKSNGALSQVGEGLGKAGNKLLQLTKGALIFSVITKGLTMLRQTLGSVLMADEGFRQSLYQLQAAFWAAFAPIYNYVLPALKTLINWLTQAVVAIGKFIAIVTGQSYSTMVANGKKLQQQSEAYKDISSGSKKAASGMKKATEEAKKQLATFDELNILSEEKANADSGSGADIGGAGADGFTEGFGGLQDIDGSEEISTLTTIGNMLVGAALVGLGILLMFNGNFALGLSAVVAGIVLETKAAEEGQNLGETEKNNLITIGTIIGAALIGIGVLLLFTTFWKIGLSAIAMGATTVYGTLALGEFKEDVKKKVTDILALVGTVLVVLGTILLFIPGAEGVGLKMLAMGAVEISAAVVMNFEVIKAWISENFVQLLTTISYYIFIIGVILCFIPGMMNWGFGCMIAGIVLLGVTTIASNYEEIKTEITKFFDENWKAVTIMMEALLILGVVLLFIGHPLIGFGLIAIASVALWKALNPDSQATKDEINNFFTTYKDEIAALGEFLLILGIILLFTPANLVGIALIAAGIGCLGIEMMALNDLDLKTKLKTLLNGLLIIIENFLNHATKGFRDLANAAIGLMNEIGGAIGIEFDIPSIPQISIPRLAQGAVIPANREFLAVLGDQKSGTNIEAPLATIEEAVENVLARTGYGGGNQTIVLELDGREVGRTFGKVIRNESKRTGTSFVKTKLAFT